MAEAMHTSAGLSRKVGLNQVLIMLAILQVSIREPYDISSVSTTQPGEGAIVERVKKVVCCCISGQVSVMLKRLQATTMCVRIAFQEKKQ